MTISLPPRLVEKLDDEVRQGRRPTRSAAVAAALDAYYARCADDLLREATIAYYRGQPPGERAEDEAIARASRDAGAVALRSDERALARRRSRRRT